MADERHEVRRIIAEVARAVDRRLGVEVRELPRGERLQLILTYGSHQTQTEVPISAVLAAAESPVARNELRLRARSASSSTSLAVRSRWLVGSSRRRQFDGSTRSLASASRLRSPPESTAVRFSTASPEKRKAPSSERTCGAVSIDAAPVTSSSAVRSGSSISAWSCAK